MIKVETKIVKVLSVKLNPGNPRTITKPDMARLMKSIQDFPERMKLREIIVDETMTVLGGNMRLLALKELGFDECQVRIVSGLTKRQKKEFVIKDNAAFGEWDFDVLANKWGDLPLVDWGVRNNSRTWEPGESGGSGSGSGQGDSGPEEPNIIICPKCKHEFSVLKEKKE